MTAALLNGITNSLVTAGNAIDRTNLTAGAGIDASQIKPSSGAAGTFGGSVAYTFPLSLVTTVGSNSVVPLTIQGNAGGGQTSDLLDVLLQPAGTNFFKITAAGNIVSAGPLNQFASAGDLQIAPTINAGNVLGRVSPVYNNSSVAVGAAYHTVTDFITLTSTGSTAQGTLMAFTTSNTITLSGPQVFTSATSYTGFAQDLQGHSLAIFISPISGTQFVLRCWNVSTAAIGTGATVTIGWSVCGT